MGANCMFQHSLANAMKIVHFTAIVVSTTCRFAIQERRPLPQRSRQQARPQRPRLRQLQCRAQPPHLARRDWAVALMAAWTSRRETYVSATEIARPKAIAASTTWMFAHRCRSPSRRLPWTSFLVSCTIGTPSSVRRSRVWTLRHRRIAWTRIRQSTSATPEQHRGRCSTTSKTTSPWPWITWTPRDGASRGRAISRQCWASQRCNGPITSTLAT
mmetsp:Transcript_87631/g.220484  ORF Transcript_87631/g.220484 Transcript_87631/m.220484 type:complete len:215 (+) Transcript_87631:1011-1655(+)